METDIAKRLEELRAALRAENISYGELADLQGLAEHIAPDDVELREAAGIPEFPDEPRFDTINSDPDVPGHPSSGMIGIIDEERGGIIAWATDQAQADALIRQLSSQEA